MFLIDRVVIDPGLMLVIDGCAWCLLECDCWLAVMSWYPGLMSGVVSIRSIIRPLNVADQAGSMLAARELAGKKFSLGGVDHPSVGDLPSKEKPGSVVDPEVQGIAPSIPVFSALVFVVDQYHQAEQWRLQEAAIRWGLCAEKP
jgi:hypothetical protein